MIWIMFPLLAGSGLIDTMLIGSGLIGTMLIGSGLAEVGAKGPELEGMAIGSGLMCTPGAEFVVVLLVSGAGLALVVEEGMLGTANVGLVPFRDTPEKIEEPVCEGYEEAEEEGAEEEEEEEEA